MAACKQPVVLLFSIPGAYWIFYVQLLPESSSIAVRKSPSLYFSVITTISALSFGFACFLDNLSHALYDICKNSSHFCQNTAAVLNLKSEK